jgi:hypothetical protein
MPRTPDTIKQKLANAQGFCTKFGRHSHHERLLIWVSAVRILNGDRVPTWRNAF